VRALADLLRRAVLPALALALVAAPAAATWSIVVVNTKTGEAGVAGATCLPGTNLKRAIALVYNDVGVAAAQSNIDTGAVNRKVIWNSMAAGLSPDDILQILAQTDPLHQGRQYGIVTFDHDPATFTGTACGLAATGVAKIVGDLRYAVQGNVLTGDPVVFAAEQALLSTPGDLSQKLMAAMEAARALGGDGRCSCSSGSPTSCGVPPPNFTKSAHTSFIVVARIGDRRGGCNSLIGCASGRYFLDLKFKGTALDPDPVISLARLYAQWRAGMAGRPDQVQSSVVPETDWLPADGQSTARVEFELEDIDGNPVLNPALAFTLEHSGSLGPFAQAGPIVPLGGGRYEFTLTAGTLVGRDRYRIVVDDGQGPVALQPSIYIKVGN